MDLELTPTPTSTKSTDDTEIDETPQHTSPLSFTSGAHNHTHQPPLPPAPPAYRECMKNHAAAIGGHAVDGCGEFMPSPSATAAEPTSLKCAACGCHRNFHRREPDSPTAAITPPFLDFRHPSLPKRFSLSPSPPSQAAGGPVSCAPQFLFSLSTAVAAEKHHQAPVTPTAENPVGRKRFRTKFSQEQKERMHSFSEKLGWKMQKSDEAAVRDFCHEIGVAKGVLKVWMHNNKNTFGKKEINGGGGGDGDIGKVEERKIDNNGDHFQNYECGNGAHFHSSNNGSSSPPC